MSQPYQSYQTYGALMNGIHDRILTNVFGAAVYSNAGSLLRTISMMSDREANEMEFEVRPIDEDGSCSLNTFHRLDGMVQSNGEFVSFTAVVVDTFQPSIPLSNIVFRRDGELYEEKVTVQSVYSQKVIGLPLSMKLSREISANRFQISDYINNKQMRLRASYRFTNPYLSSWRVDETIRLSDIPDTKPTYKDFSKYYGKGTLDMEFEYVPLSGSYKNVINDFMTLVSYIYEDFRSYNVDYFLASTIVNSLIPPLFPDTGSKTQSTAATSINQYILNDPIMVCIDEDVSKYVFVNKPSGRSNAIVIITGLLNEPEKRIVITNSSIHSFSYGIFRAYSDITPPVSVMLAYVQNELPSGELFDITDHIIIDSELLIDKTFTERFIDRHTVFDAPRMEYYTVNSWADLRFDDESVGITAVNAVTGRRQLLMSPDQLVVTGCVQGSELFIMSSSKAMNNPEKVNRLYPLVSPYYPESVHIREAFPDGTIINYNLRTGEIHTGPINTPLTKYDDFIRMSGILYGASVRDSPRGVMPYNKAYQQIRQLVDNIIITRYIVDSQLPGVSGVNADNVVVDITNETGSLYGKLSTKNSKLDSIYIVNRNRRQLVGMIQSVYGSSTGGNYPFYNLYAAAELDTSRGVTRNIYPVLNRVLMFTKANAIISENYLDDVFSYADLISFKHSVKKALSPNGLIVIKYMSGTSGISDASAVHQRYVEIHKRGVVTQHKVPQSFNARCKSTKDGIDVVFNGVKRSGKRIPALGIKENGYICWYRRCEDSIISEDLRWRIIESFGITFEGNSTPYSHMAANWLSDAYEIDSIAGAYDSTDNVSLYASENILFENMFPDCLRTFRSHGIIVIASVRDLRLTECQGRVERVVIGDVIIYILFPVWYTVDDCQLLMDRFVNWKQTDMIRHIEYGGYKWPIFDGLSNLFSDTFEVVDDYSVKSDVSIRSSMAQTISNRRTNGDTMKSVYDPLRLLILRML